MEAKETAIEAEVESSTELAKKPKTRIRDWKGLVHDEDRRVKYLGFVAMFVVATSMTFMQLGFIGVGTSGSYICYLMGHLVPIAATALLLGKGAGALQGLLCGSVQLAHAWLQPLNLVERYFIGPMNSIMLLTGAGFMLGLFFAIALRNKPTGLEKVFDLGCCCGLTAFITSIQFIINAVLDVILLLLYSYMGDDTVSAEVPHDWAAALSATGRVDVQMWLDFALLFATVLTVEYLARRYHETKGTVSVRVTFASRLLAVVTLSFLTLSALAHCFITTRIASSVSDDMLYDANFIAREIREGDEALTKLFQRKDMENASGDVIDTIVNSSYLQTFVDGYNLGTYGTVAVFSGNEVLFSNSPAFPKGASLETIYGDELANYPYDLANSGEMWETLYDTRPLGTGGVESGVKGLDLGFARAVVDGETCVMIEKPFAIVFDSRNAMMVGSTLLSFCLFTVVYILTARLLGKDVVSPIDRTNESLAQITAGDLEVRVNERENVEFQSLSEGINNTVDALKGYIGEAEARMEADLDTAKTIQKSALPRVFPPFPEVDKFDIFASMDAAKSVGGDFYDYFLIDDHTLGFLIADVSGKGVPGALFMMASKTELENYMNAGMDLSQAIATANKRLCANNDAGMFVTVWAATLDYETGELTYVNAGHNYPLLRHGVGGEWEWLKQRGGFFLGVFDTAKYDQHTLTLQPGDELLLYTDGVNEAFNVDDEEYGNERLEAFLASHATMHSREIVRSLRADVARWADGAEQSDDVTILALEYGVAPEVTGTITLPATLDNLSVATDFVNAELEARLCPVDVQHKVEMALEELFVNICRYAYADQDEPGSVKLRYAYGVNPSTITIELRDQGIPFDPIKREDPTKPASAQEATIGGLGIYMVRQMMDDFTYMRHGNTNVVVIKKGW